MISCRGSRNWETEEIRKTKKGTANWKKKSCREERKDKHEEPVRLSFCLMPHLLTNVAELRLTSPQNPERARSISPTKSSPSTTPSTSRILSPPSSSLIQSNTLKIDHQLPLEAREDGIEDAMARLTGSPTKENNAPNEMDRIRLDPESERVPMKDSPSSAMPTRKPTLSWQQRPKSRGADRPRQRPLSIIATENAARSPRQTPEPTTANEETMSREQIAQSLSAKDPSWFRQTADRGLSSPAYRKNQVEDVERAEHGSNAARYQMPGMSRVGTPSEMADQADTQSHSPSRSYGYGNESRLSGGLSTTNDSPLSLTPAQKLDPPSYEDTSVQEPTISPTQGRRSPERRDRPPSPTKGLGGFVQSAMMKRSDSVNKRWSVQSPPGLQRGNSVASNRNSQDVSKILDAERGIDSSPASRPSSSHSNATITQDRPGSSMSMNSNVTNTTLDDGFVKPTIPASRSRSPTKASWLESALNKPESPKPQATPPPQQPSWRTKNSSVDLGQSPLAPVKHEVNIGGLLRSPPLGVNSSSVAASSSSPFSPSIASRLEDRSAQNGYGSPSTTKSAAPGAVKVKPETPPKKDFRATLKSRQPLPDTSKSEEPEFKAAFGQLKRTKTVNYVAPDVLKDNITRGKGALNITGGPVKAERRDDFKEAILKKKDDFKAAQAEGKTTLRATSLEKKSNTVPEALLKRQALGRSSSVSNTDDPTSLTTSKVPPVSPKPPSLVKETSAPARLQGKDAGGKLAGRFNPALAGLLARGPPSIATKVSRSSSPVTSPPTSSSISDRTKNSATSESGSALTHMTKGRARGPKRKAPTTTLAAVSPSRDDFAKHTAGSTPVIQTRQPEAITVIGEPQLDSPSKISSQPFAQTTPMSRDEPVSQPSSPRKLDMKRRSQFLQDTAAPKAESLVPRPLSPAKKESISTTPSKSQPSKLEIKARPDTPIKTPSLKPKPSPKPQEQAAFAQLSSKNQAEGNKSSPVISIMPLRVKSPLLDNEKREPLTPSRDNSSAFSSVRNAAAGWSKTPELPTRARSPIKLPTHADEKAALIGAGLRSPSPENKGSSIGLGIQNTPRALPIPPTKPTAAMPQPDSSRSVVADSPSGPIKSPVLSSSNTSSKSLVLGFFDASLSQPKYAIDTASVLSSPTNDQASVKTLRSTLFQLLPDGKKQAVPGHQERMLFEDDMYLCTHIYGNSAGKKVSEAYYWIGDEVPETTANETNIFAQKEAKSAGADLVIIKQGKETPEFFSALGGIIITRRGSAHKYDSLSPHILCGRKQFGHIAFDEVDFAASSLCSGFAYLISTDSGKCYLWRGKGVHADELSCARLIGMDFGVTGDIEEVEDGAEPGSFITIFGPGARIPNSADHWKLKPGYNKYSGRLFLASDDQEQVSASSFVKSPSLSFFRSFTNIFNPKSQISEISPYTQADLDPRNIYILDAFFEIYVIVGAKSQNQYNAFHHALTFAQEYGILAASIEDRPRVPFTTVVMEGVPKDMKSLFRKWRDALSPTVMQATGLQRGKSLRVVGLNAALEAIKS